MFTFLISLLATIVLSFIPERFLKPYRPKVWGNITQQALIVTFLFLMLTLIVQRPVFSSITVLVFLIIMVGVSNTKFSTLREPLVFSDFTMFSQAFKHPRLYFPFLGLAPLIIAPLVILALIILVLALEPAMSITWQRIVGTVLTLLALRVIIKSRALNSLLTFDPAEDNQTLGLLNTVIAYLVQSRTVSHKQQIKQRLRAAPFYTSSGFKDPSIKTPGKDRPANITVIQSESFFDARRLHPSVKTDILQNFDRCNAESLQHGKLTVPAWGANTMRSEFSFLTGLANENIGLYRYYPYAYLKEMPVTSIASALQKQGYHTVCIHPHHSSFFGRNKIFPKLGFDEFIDGKSFDQDSTFGPYISDEAVSEKILQITKEKTNKPLFIFAITMENHGPLHLEKITDEEKSILFKKDKSIEHLDELGIYLRHLVNADNMIRTLEQAYKTSKSETVLCFYGDHVPSMPKTYALTDYQNSQSDYFIWSSKSSKNATPKKKGKGMVESTDLSVENLAKTLLS